MNIGKVIGRSIWKATKYVGLTAAGGAVAGVAGVFDPGTLSVLLDIALDGDVASVAVPLVSTLLGGAVGPILAISLQQIYKHRDRM